MKHPAGAGAWSNWAGDQICWPQQQHRPASTEEVVTAVEQARADGRRLRVAGSGHSFTGLALTDGTLLDLGAMAAVIDVNRTSGRVRVEAGITLHQLSIELDRHGLALPNLGDIDEQSLAGAISTGTHGTGIGLQNISAQVAGLQLVTADGTVTEVNRSRDPDLLDAARISVGALGVITEVALDTVPAFRLRSEERREPLAEVLASLDERVDGNDHFEFFAFPHSPLALTRHNNRTDEPAQSVGGPRAYVDDVLLANHAFGAMCRVGRRFPGSIPRINRLVSRAASSRVRVANGHDIFANPRLVRFNEMEYSIPRADAATAITAVFDCIRDRGFAVPFPLEVRFVRGDDGWLSPAHQRDSCYIAVHMYEGMRWRDYFAAVEGIMNGFQGRPHWGKRHFQTAATLATRYPRWGDFTATRARLDPDGLFSNDHLDRLLGRVAAPVAP